MSYIIFTVWKIFSSRKFLILFFRLGKFTLTINFLHYFSDLENLLPDQTFYIISPTWKTFFDIQFLVLFLQLGKFSPILNFFYYFSNLDNFVTDHIFSIILPAWISFYKYIALENFLRHQIFNTISQFGKFSPRVKFLYTFSDLKNFLSPNFFYYFSDSV